MSEAFVHLVANAAILLSLVYMFDLLRASRWLPHNWMRQAVTGLVVGMLGLVIMHVPWTLGPGVFFDTRTVLLAISGLFFGTVPTAIAIGMTAAYRLSLGGTGVVMGVGTIVSAGLLGIVWRHAYGRRLDKLTFRTLYALGLVVHAVMLALSFTMPMPTALSVLQSTALPVIVIHPLATATIGLLIVDRLQRGQQAAAIAESEGTFRALLEQASVGIAKVDTMTRRYLVVNQRYADILGYRQDELIGKDFVDITHPEDRTAHEDSMHRMMTGQISGFSLEKRYLRKDGSTVWVDATVSALWAPGQAPSSHMVMIVDITQRKEAEEALRRSEADLRQAQAVAHVGSWRWDIRQDRLTWSDEMYHIYGIPADQPPQSWEDVVNQLVHPEDRERVLAANSAVVSQHDISPLEYRIIRPDGAVRTIWDQTGEMKTDAEGHVVSLIGVAMDITERKQAEEALQALNAQLEERVRQRTAQLEAANKELEAFSYSVSHDLRAPLRSIDGFTQAFLDDFGQSVPPEGREDLERVRRAAQRMSTLIDDMLSLSRITRSTIQTEDVDLSQLAADIITELRREEPQRDVQVDIEPSMHVTGDRMMLRVVMENLLGNAWKFTSRKEHAHITVGTTTDAQHGPAFFVRDDGAGFDPQYKDKLFVPFQRLHTTQEFPGTGIGLATIQRAVRRHGGEAWAEGAVEQGATFFFTIPASSEQASAKEEP